MRYIRNINRQWKFIKESINITTAASHPGKNIDLPHTWNALDGQERGNDYYRGNGTYARSQR